MNIFVSCTRISSAVFLAEEDEKMPEELSNIEVKHKRSENVIVLVGDVWTYDVAEIPHEVEACKNDHRDTHSELPLVTLEDEDFQENHGDHNAELDHVCENHVFEGLAWEAFTVSHVPGGSED